jgi:heat shock protein HtpX
MAMDFWEAQRRARSRTTLYLILFVILTLVVSTCAEMAMRYYGQDSYDVGFPLVGGLFFAVTMLVAGCQYLSFKAQGGRYVAESLGARPVSPATGNFQEKQLLNIVQEMAIAAGVPMPPVYIIEGQEINAFAAGLTHSDAAVTVTRGAMQVLTREELQGVIGHEFGHIYNGDMKISMRLAAMVMGFFFIMTIGLRILQFSSFGGRNNENRKGPNPVLLAGLIFIVAGVVTWFFGSILKACVSREREYLADACAVQFIRSPDGIANALRKIGGYQTRSGMPLSGMAYSHLYFDDRSFLSNLFATHPPLKDRIAAIEGHRYSDVTLG